MANKTTSTAPKQPDSNGRKNGLVFRKNIRVLDVAAWKDVDASLLRSAVHAATMAGAAIILGVTSDGGAYSICVLDQDQKVKEYPHGVDECEQSLQDIIDFYVDR